MAGAVLIPELQLKFKNKFDGAQKDAENFGVASKALSFLESIGEGGEMGCGGAGSAVLGSNTASQPGSCPRPAGPSGQSCLYVCPHTRAPSLPRSPHSPPAVDTEVGEELFLTQASAAEVEQCRAFFLQGARDGAGRACLPVMSCVMHLL